MTLVTQVISKLVEGTIAFVHPEVMQLDEEALTKLTVSPEEDAEALASSLQHIPGRVQTASGVKLSPRMTAELTGEAFTISAKTPAHQLVSGGHRTEWTWTIEPKEDGDQYLHLALSAHVKLEGEDAPYVVKTFERKIEVEVRPSKRLGDFAATHWQWAFSTLLIPVGVWMYKKRGATT